MKKNYLTILLCLLVIGFLYSQERNSSYIFGNSLVHHEFQVNPTPSQETSVPHWLYYLSEASNHSYEVSGQYGFLPQHAQLPPNSNWSFDVVPNAWDSDYETFGSVDFTNVIITPANFIQWQSPAENYPYEQSSPISATESIIQWVIEQEPGITVYLYEGWPDMSPYLGSGFPPSPAEWQAYNQYMNGEFHDWNIEYLDLLSESTDPDCLKIIPVGSLLSHLLLQSPYDQIPIAELYEDDAPHGRPTLYFLAAMITYMTTYEEVPPSGFEVDPIIHPMVAENYENIINIFWDELQKLNNGTGESQVFCNEVTSDITLDQEQISEPIISPNPVSTHIRIDDSPNLHSIDILSAVTGNIIQSYPYEGDAMDLNNLETGVYLLQGKDRNNQEIFLERILKI